MNILAVIPARGGSKNVPRKNITKIDGLPLISYTISSALEVDRLTDIIVSTDDYEIGSISKELGVDVPFIRPPNLATDNSQSYPVIEHALKYMEKLRGFNYDVILMLQPTSPLRTSSHINEAIDLYNTEECDSVVSIVSVGGNHPLRMKKLDGNRLSNYVDQKSWNMLPRQVLPEVYIRNGAIYMIRRDEFIKNKELIGSNCLGYEMNNKDSVNIDTYIDLMVAEILIKNKNI